MGSGIFGVRPNMSLGFPLDKFATVFQTEIYAILQSAHENIRAYRNKWIIIFSDSQATLRAPVAPNVTSDLVAECLNALSGLAGLNAWVLGHCDILGNEEGDRLARRASGPAITRS
jgi:ribonuclease HI